MTQKRIKIQLTLPRELVELVEKETSENYTSMSLWFEKVLRQYFDEKTKNDQGTGKKVIELDI
jgi:metal-responsive CopG/Arc/MetJ family transcriptional regulator